MIAGDVYLLRGARGDPVATMGSADRTLVKRMLAGDGDAFEEFFADHFPGLYRFALMRVANDPYVADEVVQITLRTAIDRLETFRGEATLLTWLCRICRNEIADYYRRTRRRPLHVEFAEEIPEIRAALEQLSAAEPPSPEAKLRRKEIARWVRVTLDSLPARYGRALEWKYVHGMSVKEIGARLDLSPKAAESLLTRSRQAFREGFRAISSAQREWAFRSPRASVEA
jgi:RNA polymerase sigma-70 factor (ECF subfamily)